MRIPSSEYAKSPIAVNTILNAGAGIFFPAISTENFFSVFNPSADDPVRGKASASS